MDWSTLDPTDVLEPGAFPDYDERRLFFQDQLVILNIDIFILKQITHFPFHIFVGPDDLTFWVRIVHTLFDASVLRITKLVHDQRDELYTIACFKNDVLRYARAEFQKPLKNTLKEHVASLEKARESVTAIRNSRIAHHSEAFVRTNPSDYGIDLEGLLTLMNSLNAIYCVLAFKAGPLVLHMPYYAYDTSSPFDDRPDIVKLLDEIAMQSEQLRLPETNERYWDYQRRELWTEEDLQQFNEYRRKAGLPDV